MGGGLPNLTFCWGNRYCWQLGGKGNLCIPINPELWWLHCCPEKAPQKLIFSLWQQLHPFSRYSFQSSDLCSSSEFRVVRRKERRQNIKVQPLPSWDTRAVSRRGRDGQAPWRQKNNIGREWGCHTDQLGLILLRIYSPIALGAKIIHINRMHAAGKTAMKSCQNCSPKCSARARKKTLEGFSQAGTLHRVSAFLAGPRHGAAALQNLL